MTLTQNDELIIEGIVNRVVEEKLDEKFEERIKPIEKKLDKVINILDGFAGNVRTMQEELTMVEGHKDTLEDHEERITALESQVITNA